MRIQPQRGRIVALAAAAVMATGLLAGCGGDDSDDADDSSSQTSHGDEGGHEGGHGDVEPREPLPAPKVSFKELKGEVTWEPNLCTELDEFGEGTVLAGASTAEAPLDSSVDIQFQHPDGSDPVLDAVILSVGSTTWSQAPQVREWIKSTGENEYEVHTEMTNGPPGSVKPVPLDVTFTCD